MSNAAIKRRMAELKAQRARHDAGHVDARPASFKVSTVAVYGKGRKACAIVAERVKHQAPRLVEVELVSGIGERPGYLWTGPAIRSGDAPCYTV